MTTETRRRPWQGRRPAPRRPDVVVAPEALPLAELRIYTDLVLLTRRVAGGWRSYPVNPDAIAHLFAKVPAATGLLPLDTLGAGQIGGQPFLILWRPPVLTTLQTTEKTYHIPLPPLLFAGHGRDYRIWALGTPERPTTEQSLFVAPFPNCYKDGRICWGDVAGIPEASRSTITAVRKLFLEESAFNLHIADHKSVAYPASVLSRWQQLVESNADQYPLDDLVPAERSLSWVLGGGPWSR